MSYAFPTRAKIVAADAVRILNAAGIDARTVHARPGHDQWFEIAGKRVRLFELLEAAQDATRRPKLFGGTKKASFSEPTPSKGHAAEARSTMPSEAAG